MTDLHRDNGGYTGIDVRDTADPWFDNVSLLLQPAAGDTVIADKSLNAHSITNNGVTLDDTNQKWNGAASMLFERANDDNLQVTTRAVDNFDWTVSFWAYFNTLPSSNTSLFDIRNGTVHEGFDVFSKNDGLRVSTNGTVYANADAVLSTSVWHLITATRKSNTVYITVDGALEGTGDISSLTGVATGVTIGNGLNNPFDGNMSSVRFDIGPARYTAAFTPPTRPFPTRRFVSGIIQP